MIDYAHSNAVKVGKWIYANSDNTIRLERKYSIWNNSLGEINVGF